MGRDYTLFALIDGFVKFEPISRDKRRVSVYPEPVGRTLPAPAGSATA
jgi:large subunit ribosomal protein L27